MHLKLSDSWDSPSALIVFLISETLYSVNPFTNLDNSKMEESDNALLENIKKRGENSYYYAHAPRPQENLEEAKVLEGDGIVTGGPPKLIMRHDSYAEVSTTSNIRNYSWADHDGKVSVYVEFEEPVEANRVNCNFETNSLELTYTMSTGEFKRLFLKKLSKNIDPEGSAFKTRKNKVIIHLKKEIDSSWSKLNDI